MAFTKISEVEMNTHGVVGMADTPNLSARAMQEKFDELSRVVLRPAFDNLVDELADSSAAGNIGSTDGTVQSVLDTLKTSNHTHDNKDLLDTYEQTETDLSDAVSKKHSHDNKNLLDTYTQTETDLADAVSKKHEHSNKTVLDKLSDSEGNLAYDNNPISTDAYKTIKVGDTSVVAGTSDTLTLVAGDNVTLSADSANKTVTISSEGTTETVIVDQIVSTGTHIADISVNGETTELYAPTGGGGGSEVVVTPTLSEGTKIADISVDGVNKELYAPEGGETEVEVTQTLTSGTKIAEISVNGESTDLYAPEGSGGSDVEVTQVLTSGTKIAEISVDGVSKNLYAPKDTNEEITKQKENGYLGSGNLIDCDVEYTPISGICFSQMPILLKANTDYKVSYYAESGGTNKIIFYNSAKTEITNYRVVYSSGGTVLFSVNCTEEPFYWTLEYSGSGKVSKIQIVEGTTYDGYAPYSLSNAELTKKINNLNIIDDTSINPKTTFSSFKVSSMVESNVLGGDAYNSSTVYQVGAMCIDNNCLYEKIGMAESGFKPSDYPAKWQKVTLSSVNNNLTIKSGTTNLSQLTYVEWGEIVMLTASGLPSSASAVVVITGLPKPAMSYVDFELHRSTSSVGYIDYSSERWYYTSDGLGYGSFVYIKE